jgi:hypothetical protein
MATTIHLGGVDSECAECVAVATPVTCDTCGVDNATVDTYKHDGVVWNICASCEVKAEMAGEAYMEAQHEAYYEREAR